jgi:hypothetical protein
VRARAPSCAARTRLLTRRVSGLHRFETILRQADEQVSVMMNRRNTNRSQPGAARGFSVIPELDHALHSESTV